MSLPLPLPLLLLSLLGGVARSDPPPEGIDLEDVDRWETHAFDLTRGPAGCWALEGSLQIRLVLYQPASLLTRPEHQERVMHGTLQGELRDGRWTVLRYALTDAEGQPITEEVTVVPLVGEIHGQIQENLHAKPPPPPEEEKARGISISIGAEDGGGGGDAEASVNLLQASVREWWDASVTSSYVRWSAAAQGVELVIEVPTTDDPRADVVTATVFFPGGGTQPTRIDSILPTRLSMGEGLIRARLRDGQLHLRGRQVEGLLFPTEESVSAVLGVLGFTVGFEQTIRYTAAHACAS